MTVFGFEFPVYSWAVLSILLLAFAVQLYYYLRYFAGVSRHRRREMKGKLEHSEQQPPVSVIICARDEEENLRKFLPFILEQNYPDYEVIVVNDGSTDGTEDYLAFMTKQNGRLRTTFVPEGAQNISTKKLGLTLGIKAAKNDLLLFTDADCMPEGEHWMASIVRNFDEDTEFVLGYGGYLKRKGLLNKMIKYDTLFVAMQYLGMAAAGKPYMGVGRNLAYRKETFFRMKGFASNLHLKSGDDDLLVNRGANRANTRIEVQAEGTTWSEPKTTFRSWLAQKERHLSVSHAYNKKSKLRLGLEPLTRGLFYLSLIASVALGVILQNWIIVGIAGLIFIARYLLQFFIVNKASKLLGDRKFYGGLLFFDIFIPLLNMSVLLFGKKNKNIMWK